MTNTEVLEELIKQSGLKKKYIAERLGITPYYLSMKIQNKRDFNTTEIVTLCKLLNIKSAADRNSIFFCTSKVEK